MAGKIDKDVDYDPTSDVSDAVFDHVAALAMARRKESEIQEMDDRSASTDVTQKQEAERKVMDMEKRKVDKGVDKNDQMKTTENSAQEESRRCGEEQDAVSKTEPVQARAPAPLPHQPQHLADDLGSDSAGNKLRKPTTHWSNWIAQYPPVIEKSSFDADGELEYQTRYVQRFDMQNKPIVKGGSVMADRARIFIGRIRGRWAWLRARWRKWKR